MVVFLPGLGDEPRQFVTHGFFGTLERSGARAEKVAVDAHLGYYRDKTLVDRIHRDVVLPAEQRGYRRVWLVGTSLGGLGALAYAAAHPNRVAGVVLIAPFLARDGWVEKIQRSGGLEAWRARTSRPSAGAGQPAPWRGAEERFFRFVWRWAAEPRRPDGSPVPLYLGIGTEDRFASAQSLLAETLPSTHRVIVDGGHEWPVWAALWDKLVAKGIFERACGIRPAASASARRQRPEAEMGEVPSKTHAGAELR